MRIILEGIDNSGKTTLAEAIASTLGWGIQSSEGPSKYSGEIEERIKRYLLMDNIVFDRFPAISNPLYDQAFDRKPDRFDGTLIDRLYGERPVIIYCDPIVRGLHGYKSNPRTESAQHVADLDRNYDKLLSIYRSWAIARAHFIYRIGDNVDDLLDAVTGIWSARISEPLRRNASG